MISSRNKPKKRRNRLKHIEQVLVSTCNYHDKIFMIMQHIGLAFLTVQQRYKHVPTRPVLLSTGKRMQCHKMGLPCDLTKSLLPLLTERKENTRAPRTVMVWTNRGLKAASCRWPIFATDLDLHLARFAGVLRSQRLPDPLSCYPDR